MLRSRYRRITFFFARMLVSLALWELLLPRMGLKKLVTQSRSRRLRQWAASFRSLAIQMGGVLIKIGQFFSARVDVLPAEITEELAGLQDEVPEERFEAIREVIEGEFGQPLEALFVAFTPQPLAAASLGQVHNAVLSHPLDNPGQGAVGQPNGLSNVVVKVQRPDIELIINTDLAAMRTVGRWVNRYRPLRRRADVPALLNEFTRTLYEEIDYLAEGRNAETFAHNFEGRTEIRVPAVHWSRTTRRVLTLEDVQGIKITDYEAITRAGVDRAQVARRLFDTYLQQIFEDGFFHADPHPGNLFVRAPLSHPTHDEAPGSGWQLTFVDFGMTGRMPDNIRAGLRELLVAVGTRDAARSIRAYQILGLLLPGADLSLIEQAETEVFGRFYGKNMSELTSISVQEIRNLAMEYRQLIYDLPFQVPEDLILLARTIGILSGICTGLDPQFNVWESMAPYVQKLVTRDEGGREPWLEILSGWARKLVDAPRRVDSVLEKVERGDFAVHDPRLTAQMARIETAINRASMLVLSAALFLGGALLLSNGYSSLGTGAVAAAGLVFVIVMLRGLGGRAH